MGTDRISPGWGTYRAPHSGGLLLGKEGRHTPPPGSSEVQTAQPIVERYRRAFADFRDGNVNAALARFRALAAVGENPLGLGYDGLAGGHLRRLGTGEMLAALVGQALQQESGISVLERSDLEAALQGRDVGLAEPSEAIAALNVGKLLRADLIVYGSHRSYENVLALDMRVVRVSTMEVLATEHLKTQGREKRHAAARSLVERLKPIVADAMGKPSR